ncbi:BnaC08g49260D [Brassica napus]|uniref:BnaC08g49260D protein n=1 Tax=Brassica napus TaxID=3708 RepID=A0A078J5Y4_BRANA|nr:BnaC08g49260D [Brassica napus]
MLKALCGLWVSLVSSGVEAIFNDVTEIPGIRGNEVNLTFPWSTSKGITALDS